MATYITRVPTLPEKHGKLNQEMSVDKILPEPKSSSINIMPVEENFYFRRKRVPIAMHSLDIPC